MKLLAILSLAAAFACAGCAGMPPRSYTLSYTDPAGRTISGGVVLGPTGGLRK